VQNSKLGVRDGHARIEECGWGIEVESETRWMEWERL
jgi:hypothetical protein